MVSVIQKKSRQFVSFYMHKRLYGFDIRIVKEITNAKNITPVPLRMRDVNGVVNIRGQVVVVLDFGVSLGAKEQQVTEASQIIILNTSSEMEFEKGVEEPFENVDALGMLPVGFLVNAIGDIVTVETNAIEETPSHLKEEYRPFVEGVIRIEPIPLIILKPCAILGIMSL